MSRVSSKTRLSPALAAVLSVVPGLGQIAAGRRARGLLLLLGLPAQAAVKFAAQLPMLLRGLYFEGWTLPEETDRTRSLEEFAEKVGASLHPRFRFDPVTSSEAVFDAIANFVSEGEVDKIVANLPEPLRELWP